jgi:hypothetical protein
MSTLVFQSAVLNQILANTYFSGAGEDRKPFGIRVIRQVKDLPRTQGSKTKAQGAMSSQRTYFALKL